MSRAIGMSETSNTDFEPLFRRVAQTNRWDSAIACIAMVMNLPIDEVHAIAARKFNRPANCRRPILLKQIPELLEHYDWWASSRYRRATVVQELPNLAIVQLARRPDHFGLFHRQKFDDGRAPVCYLIDPNLGIPADQQVRWNLDAIVSCQYIQVLAMSDYMKDFW